MVYWRFRVNNRLSQQFFLTWLVVPETSVNLKDSPTEQELEVIYSRTIRGVAHMSMLCWKVSISFQQ